MLPIRVPMRDIPIIVMVSSRLEEEIFRSYQLGVNAFITKPVTFTRLVDAMRIVDKYWIEIVEQPPEREVA